MLQWDVFILNLIQTHLHNGWLDRFMVMATGLGDRGLVWFCLAGLLLLSKKYRPFGILMLVALLASSVIGNELIKPLVGRMRPCDLFPNVNVLIACPPDFSFPSGHAMSSFAGATMLYAANRRLGLGAYLLAGLIAFSRLYLYVHFPSDVLAGAILGILIALVVDNIYRFFFCRQE